MSTEAAYRPNMEPRVFDGPAISTQVGQIIRAGSGAPDDLAPRRPMIAAPSPIQRLKRFEREVGKAAQFYIKRDDSIRPLFGSKLRYIEYVFGAYDSVSANCVVHCGGLGSNYLAQLAMAGASEGVPIHLAVNAEADNSRLNNPRLARLFGAQVRYCHDGRTCSMLKAEWAEELASQGRRPLVIDAPFTNACAILAFLRLCRELLDQVAAGDAPMPDFVVLCSAGNSYLGLRIGADFAGAPFAIKAYSPIRFADAGLAPVAPDRPSFLVKKRREFAALIGRAIPESPINVDESMVGPGYGRPSTASIDTVRLVAQTEGILLDPIYTGKAMSGLLQDLYRGAILPGARILFIHSGGYVNAFAHHDELVGH